MPNTGFATVNAVVVAIGVLLFLILAYVALVSSRESEPRATVLACVFALILPLPYLIVGLATFPYQPHLAIALLSVTLLVVVAFIIPIGDKPVIEDDTPRSRIDERDIMFARNLLEVGTDRFREYYRRNPDKKTLDDQFRALPGLMAKGASAYNPYAFSAADASFTTVAELRSLVDGKVAPDRVITDPPAMTVFLKQWAQKLGAVSAGVTELRAYHLYTVVGRGEDYGRLVDLHHSFALAVTVEMDKRMIDCAPLGPTVMESAQQYLEAGTIAIQIAEFIRGLGYPARAHIDGNYRVVCPLVARDAGLGEIGRMGLLMTPELGPRVRIAVVTTDLPLISDKRAYDHTMIDFCVRCSKCAEACPASAIPIEDRADRDGVKRWQIDSEACFTLWCKIGTDCARCVKVCPYSHPSNHLHNLVRRGVRNSPLFRRVAITMDDVMYGRKPPPAALPDWMRLGQTQ
jgi:reductive dehalogenase